MSITKIEMPERDWQEFRIQGITGKIIKHYDIYKIEVEIMELPGECMYYSYICPVVLTDALIDKTVIGDIGWGGFNIRILCLYDTIAVS